MNETTAVNVKGEEAEKSKPKSKQRLPRGRVTLFPNWCKGCELCVTFCPTQVLAQGPNARVIVAHPEKCTACRWCELHCPDFAIFVTDIESEKSDEVEESKEKTQ
ncbi:MAG TPA: 4Fe-4S dicluster domain-containing protein [Chloroflexi bacterium]|nr:4Fe-4S dicluster domain-containing protein [Chloroflexota bacterium]